MCVCLMWRHKVCFSVTQSFGISTFVHWHSNQPWRKLKNEEHIVEACSFYKLLILFYFYFYVVKCIALGLWPVLNELNVTLSFMSVHNWALFPLLMSMEAYNVPSCVCLFYWQCCCHDISIISVIYSVKSRSDSSRFFASLCSLP